jgi:hypothetical protein
VSTEKNETIVVDEELLMTGVSVLEESQKVLNGGVSASKKVESAEQWCFSIGKKSNMLNSGVSAS